MEGFGDKSCENLLNAVEKSREVKAVNFIYALCIPMIGVDAARKIVGSVSFNGFLERMKNGQGFEDVDGIGPEKSGSVMEWYRIAKNKEALEHLCRRFVLYRGKLSVRKEVPVPGLSL